jgi:hypothetical protein
MSALPRLLRFDLERHLLAAQARRAAPHFTGPTRLREALPARGFELPGDFDAP